MVILDRRDDVWAGDGPVVRFALSQLPAYLLRQRWYPAKHLGLPQVSLAALIPVALPGMEAALAIWTATTAEGGPLRMFVPMALVPDDQPPSAAAVLGRLPAAGALLVDALAVDPFIRTLVDRLEHRAGLAQADVTFDEHTAIRRGTAEQSNTSIRFGDAILKVIRKLETGVHPELEMSRYLSEKAHFAATPPLLGWLDVDGATVCLLQSFVPNSGDGWSWILERLRATSNGPEAIGSPPNAAGSPANATGSPGGDTLAWIRRLGEATAEMHAALGAAHGEAAFDPEPVTTADWGHWTEHMVAAARRIAVSLSRLEPVEPGMQRAGDAFGRSLADLEPALRRLIPASSLAKTRHHGDYHLGQVLVRGDEAVILDFEGEPLRPLAERRAKQVPLRDVAGMLRSFAYAAAVAARELPGSLAAAERESRIAALRRWLELARTAFLDGYFATGNAGPGCPRDRQEALRLVQFFTIEKALYEVEYELANRPEWTQIPLADVVELLAVTADGVRRGHRLPQGAELLPDGGTRFRLWAPGCTTVGLALGTNAAAGGDLRMTPQADGWHEATVPTAGAGTRYSYVLSDGQRVPDPASRFQPDDVHGPSEVIDPRSYAWQDGAWAGRPWHEAVVYELHVGTFTSEGTFLAAIGRLDHLRDLGVTALELMPVGDFPGRRNWGYDGVLPYAPDACYGRPEDLKALIDAAHARGLMMLLDVVYNHFGPDGNYLPLYAPAVFTERHHTPWGAAVNFDGTHSAPVREFVIHNALYWLDEYHFDGLRLDAVHAILDDSATHVLDELAERARQGRRHVHLILENEENQAQRLRRGADGRPLHYTAQWNDDVHHALHAAATGEDAGYYRDYRGDTAKLGRALAEGFAFQGEIMEFRGTPRGEPSSMLPPTAFVAFIQNHDQVGNRAFGERITAVAPTAAVRALAAVYLLLPQVPMLFMGEEWGARQPFPFFCDFDGALAEAVRKGRREEFKGFPQFQDPAARERIPDPQADATFAAAKLDWSDLPVAPHAEWLALYSRLLAVRRDVLVPLLPRIGAHAGRFEVVGPGAVIARWRIDGGRDWVLAANLAPEAVHGLPPIAGPEAWREGTVIEGGLGPWSVRWSLAGSELSP